MAVEIRTWPGREDNDSIARDAGVDLVIHYAPDGQPWLWEIEHASRHPEHIAAALSDMRRQALRREARSSDSLLQTHSGPG
jgi:hypothetical protein